MITPSSRTRCVCVCMWVWVCAHLLCSAALANVSNAPPLLQVISFTFPGYPAPPLSLIYNINNAIYGWLKADMQNCVVVHCQVGASFHCLRLVTGLAIAVSSKGFIVIAIRPDTALPHGVIVSPISDGSRSLGHRRSVLSAVVQTGSQRTASAGASGEEV